MKTRFNRIAILALALAASCGLVEASDAVVVPQQHWSFQPVKRPTPPEVGDQSLSAIDRFIRAGLKAKGLRPVARADWRTLVRRVWFNITGLPPTPEELEAFLATASPATYRQLVDRLLADRGYGERWGQHWLDVIRYAESEGFEYDRHLPDGWRFRDYVINSFNEDKPFERFITEQLAGDELEPTTPETLVAAGFHRLGPVRRNAGNPDIALSRNEVLTERTDIIGSAFLGLSVGCARCHDHKLDPISQRDYYQLEAYLAATAEHNVSLATEARQQEWEQATKALDARIARVKKSLTAANEDAKEKLAAQLKQLEAQRPSALPTITSIRDDSAERTPIHILKRGVWEQKGEAVGMRPPAVLVSDALPELAADTPRPRLRLAAWLTDPANPLTARVIVNRIWQHHFGTGLVKTANDFGLNGARPSHPELLDHLAAELVRHDWRLKPIHRMILLSAAFQQTSQVSEPRAERLDPENRLLWRGPHRRLQAEEIRDAMLAVSGRLNPRAGGPGVMLPVDPELIALLYKPAQWVVTTDAREHDRRSIYLVAKRNLRLPFLEVFDQPTLINPCARRESGTHAPQALELLNGRTSNDLADAFAQRLRAEAGDNPERQIARAYQLAAGRSPSPREHRLATAFLRSGSLREFALAVFNLNAFLHVF